MEDINKYNILHPTDNFGLDNIDNNNYSYKHVIYIYLAYELNKKHAETDNIHHMFQQYYATLKIISPIRRYL